MFSAKIVLVDIWMNIQQKRKNDENELIFEPGGCLSAYLLAQLYLVFVSLGTLFTAITSGLLFKQPFLMLCFIVLSAVGMLTLKSLMHLWDGERKGYCGLIACFILFFAYLVDYTLEYHHAGILYMILMIVNFAILLILIRPKYHLMR